MKSRPRANGIPCIVKKPGVVIRANAASGRPETDKLKVPSLHAMRSWKTPFCRFHSR
jgi:hypothetical protein